MMEKNFKKLKESADENSRKLISVLVKQDQLERTIQKNFIELQGQPVDSELKNVFPMDSVQEVFNFEQNLNNENYRNKIIKHLQRIHGAGQPWKHTAYKLSSALFTKKLLTQFSWTGLSRKTQSKEAFGKLVNILDVFYHVVYHADCTFSHRQKEEFFKDCILKHSESRWCSKPKKSLPKCLQEFQNLEDIVENQEPKINETNLDIHKNDDSFEVTEVLELEVTEVLQLDTST